MYLCGTVGISRRGGGVCVRRKLTITVLYYIGRSGGVELFYVLVSFPSVSPTSRRVVVVNQKPVVYGFRRLLISRRSNRIISEGLIAGPARRTSRNASAAVGHAVR